MKLRKAGRPSSLQAGYIQPKKCIEFLGFFAGDGWLRIRAAEPFGSFCRTTRSV
jgi:hypothetical protein